MYSKQKETNSETRAWKHNQYSSFCFSLTDFATATINLAFVCHDKLSLLFFLSNCTCRSENKALRIFGHASWPGGQRGHRLSCQLPVLTACYLHVTEVFFVMKLLPAINQQRVVMLG